MFGKYASSELKVGQLNALVKKVGGHNAVLSILRGELEVVVGKPGTMVKAKSSASPRVLAGLLEQVGEPIKLPAIPRFVAREKFVVNRAGELPISGLGANFQRNFLDVVEEEVKAATLKQRKLLKRSVDAPILAALGDKDLAKIEKAKIALAHLFGFLKTADRPKWFVFYVADAKGVVWAVDAYWDDDGWCVGANPVSNPSEWSTGYRVVSR